MFQCSDCEFVRFTTTNENELREDATGQQRNQLELSACILQNDYS